LRSDGIVVITGMGRERQLQDVEILPGGGIDQLFRAKHYDRAAPHSHIFYCWKVLVHEKTTGPTEI
jgi:hypothetical protein